MSATIEGTTGPWEIVVGLEVHAQIVSQAKLFSGAATAFGAEPNTQVSFIDAAFPGMLPTINRECVAQAVRTGLGLDARINQVSRFDRKNYFYADLPSGYQISQFTHPIVGSGRIEIELADGTTRDIGITRLHLEQDAGKSLHDQDPERSFVDLNRSGVALMEIVSEPDMRSSEEAGAYVRKLRTILRYLGTCDGNMDEGLATRRRQRVGPQARRALPHPLRNQERELRPLRPAGHRSRSPPPGRDLGVRRHGRPGDPPLRSRPQRDPLAALKRGCPRLPLLPRPRPPPAGAGRRLDRVAPRRPPRTPRRQTRPLRPRLGPVALRRRRPRRRPAPSPPTTKRSPPAATPSSPPTGSSATSSPSSTRTTWPSPTPPSPPIALGGLLDLITDGTINGKIAKEVFEAMVETGDTAADIVEQRGLRQVVDTAAIDQAIAGVLAANPDKLAEYHAGKDKLFGFFVGQVMKAMAGRGNPALVNEALKRALAPK